MCSQCLLGGWVRFNSIQFQFENVLFRLFLSRETFIMNNEKGPINFIKNDTNLIFTPHDQTFESLFYAFVSMVFSSLLKS